MIKKSILIVLLLFPFMSFSQEKIILQKYYGSDSVGIILSNSQYEKTIMLLPSGSIDINSKTILDKAVIYDTINGIAIDTTHGLKLYGVSTVWDDLMFPFSTGTSGAAGYPAFDTDSMYYSFVVDSTGPSQCTMYFVIQMPHSWNGTTIYPHVHYKQVGANKPQFRMKYKWYNIGESGVTAWKWYVMNLGTSTTTNTHAMMYGTGISGSGKTISSILVAKIYLYALASGETSCKAWQFDVHYEKDGLGSRKEILK